AVQGVSEIDIGAGERRRDRLGGAAPGAFNGGDLLLGGAVAEDFAQEEGFADEVGADGVDPGCGRGGVQGLGKPGLEHVVGQGGARSCRNRLLGDQAVGGGSVAAVLKGGAGGEVEGEAARHAPGVGQGGETLRFAGGGACGKVGTAECQGGRDADFGRGET